MGDGFGDVLGADWVSVLFHISLSVGEVVQCQTQSFLSRFNVSVLTQGKIWDLFLTKPDFS